jgi:D-amino-acid dehydrogenase
MMPNMMPRVGRGRAANVFYNTGHGHLGWTLSAVTADMVAGVVQQSLDSGVVSSWQHKLQARGA